MIEIRALTSDDLPVLLPLVRALSVFHGDEASVSEADLERMLLGASAQGWCLMAWNGGACVGYGAVFVIPRLHYGAFSADLHHLYVVENMRGKGVGRMLVEAVSERAKEMGATSIIIGTDPDNTGAQHAYRAIGLEDAPTAGPRFRRVF